MIKPLKHPIWLGLLAGMMLFSTGWDSEEPSEEGPGEEEVITTVTLSLAGDDGSVASATWRDLDGEGGNNPTIETLTLTAGVSYTGTIMLLNEEENEDITEEVEEEAAEHQLWYTVSGGAAGRVVVTITDRDPNNLPTGLEYTVAVSAGDPATGSLNVVLSHYDDAPKDGVTLSDESDIDIDIPINIVN